MERVFLGTGTDRLERAAAWLEAEHPRPGQATVVLPTRRTGRNFEAALVRRGGGGGDGGDVVDLPRILTPSAVMDLPLEVPGGVPREKIPDDLQTRLIWAAVLRAADPRSLTVLMGDTVERGAVDAGAWWRLADTVARVRRDLASVRMDLGDLAERATRWDTPGVERFRRLAELEAAYRARLRSDGQVDREDARAEALARLEAGRADGEQERSPAGGGGRLCDVVLVGVPEWSAFQHAVLSQCGRVDVLLMADAADGGAFDAWGAVRAGHWSTRGAGVAKRDRVWVRRSSEEPAAVAGLVAELGRAASAAGEPLSQDRVSIGVGSDAVGPAMVEAVAAAGGVARWAVGRPLSELGPAVVLEALAGFWATDRVESLATLMRHGSVAQAVTRRLKSTVPWVQTVDRFRATTLMDRVPTVAGVEAMPPDPASQREQNQDPDRDRKGGDRRRALMLEVARAAEVVRGWSAGGDGRGGGVVEREVSGRRGWAAAFLDALAAIYGEASWPTTPPPTARGVAMGEELECLQTLSAVLRELRDDGARSRNNPPDASDGVGRAEAEAGNEAGDGGGWRMDAEAAAAVVQRMLARQRATPAVVPGAVEVMGLLDLAMDPVPVVVMSGCNEGQVPRRPTGDGLLPERLREACGLPTAEQRLAVDTYAMHLVGSGRDAVRVTAARTGNNDEPLVPSRTLLYGSDERLGRRGDDDAAAHAAPARRLRYFFEGPIREPGPPTPLPGPNAFGPAHPDKINAVAWLSGIGRGDTLPTPEPEPEPDAPPARQPLPPLTRLKVTAFKDYLTCPYRFYLRHVLKLDTPESEPTELTAADFGTLVHHTLEAFARSPEAVGLDNPALIARFLQDTLSDTLRRRFGSRLRAAVRLQELTARERLAAYADVQARWTAEGWSPLLVEETFEQAYGFPTGELTLSAKIDRVDRHADGRLRVIDFKTGDRGDQPTDTHFKRKPSKSRPIPEPSDWRDLQLPLYRMVLRAAGVLERGTATEFGYAVLPRNAEDTRWIPADWPAETWGTAEAAAADVAAGVTAGVFWPPAPPPPYDDGLSSLAADAWNGRADWIAAQTPASPRHPEVTP